MNTILSSAISFLLFIQLYQPIQAQTLGWAWADGAGGSEYDSSNGIATDADGNLFIVGSYLSNTITFGNITLTNQGSSDIFIVKYNADGNVAWANSMGGAYSDYGLGMTTDNDGNVLITGEFSSPTVAFDDVILTNQSGSNYKSDYFLAKYDTDGNVLWAKSSGGNERDYGLDVATDATGNVYVTGMYRSDEIVFGSTTFHTDENQNFFLAKYDTDGNVLWARTGEGQSDDNGEAVTVDSSGNVTMVGSTYSPTLTINGNVLTNHGMQDMFIVSYTPDGTYRWAVIEGGTTTETAYGITSDSFDNVYVFSHFESPSITVANNTYNVQGFRNILLVKYATTGDYIWAKSPNGTGWEDAQDIAIDTDNNLYLIGFYNAPTFSMDDETINNTAINNTQDIYMAKLDNDGNTLWMKTAGGASDDYGIRIIPAVDGSIYITASFTGSNVNFGTTSLTSEGDWDVVTAKLSEVVSSLENDLSQTISIYPNPISRSTQLKTTTNLNNATVTIENIMGKRVVELQHINGHIIPLNTNQLAAGCYSLTITNDNKTFIQKLIVQK